MGIRAQTRYADMTKPQSWETKVPHIVCRRRESQTLAWEVQSARACAQSHP